jgi:hypothetical protein
MKERKERKETDLMRAVTQMLHLPLCAYSIAKWMSAMVLYAPTCLAHVSG